MLPQLLVPLAHLLSPYWLTFPFPRIPVFYYHQSIPTLEVSSSSSIITVPCTAFPVP